MRAAAVLLLSLCALSCAGLPPLAPAGETEKAGIVKEALAPFLKAPRRLVHSIDGTLPGGSRATMIGISAADPGTGKIRCTLMSIEGLVLLDAEYDAKLVIRRGIGPLASPDLVKGMLRDVRLMLFPPSGPAGAGTLRDGRRACRFRAGDGAIDLVMGAGDVVDLILYDRSGRVARRVRFTGARSHGAPAHITLAAYGMYGYTLDLDLIEAEPLR